MYIFAMNALEDKYTKTYFAIIEGRKSNPLLIGYTENHHIVPVSLGGSNNKENLVRLSAKEHYICHLLLTKMFDCRSKEYRKMLFAWGMMAWAERGYQERYKVNGRIYNKLKEELSKIRSSGIWAYNETLCQNKIFVNGETPEGWTKGINKTFAKKREKKGQKACSSCGKNLKKFKKKYCDKKCAWSSLNIKSTLDVLEKICLNCNQIFLGNYRKKYCSNACRNSFEFKNAKIIKVSRGDETKEIKVQNFRAYEKLGWKKI